MNKIKTFRNDAIEKVTGHVKYSADVNMNDMLRAKVLWPEYPVAKIKKIDISLAEKIEGVEKIITRKDIQGPNLAAIFEPYDRPVLVGEGEEVKFLGDALAIVIAQNEEIAEKALEEIVVDYEILPGIFTLEESMSKTVPVFYTDEIKKGDIEKGLSNADIIIEHECDFPYIEHAYMEPEAGYSFTDNQGIINVVFGCQNLDRHHRMICKSLDLPFKKVRLHSPFMGGAFGGKHSNSVQIYLALIASLISKPVKMVWTREESFFASSKRHKINMKAKLGLNEDGKITAIDVKILSESGPYIGYTEKTLIFATRFCFAPYWIDHINVVGEIYKTNNAEIGAYRGFGGSEGSFMIETLIEKAAKKLNIPSEEIRKINLVKEEQIETLYPGALWKVVSGKITAEEALGKALELAGPKPTPKPGKKIGRGISIAMPTFEIGTTPGYRGTGADMTMFLDGTINVRIGFPEAGQGITGVVTRITSEILDMPEENISIVYADTHVTPKAGSLGFSRGTVNGGNATIDAARKLKQRLEDEAKKYLKTEDHIEYKKGDFFIGDKLTLEFGEFMDYCYYQGVNLTVSGWFASDSPVEKHGVTFMGSVMDIEIDEETGEYKVLKIVNVHDIGKAIHPESARGQIIGGAIMKLGIASTEEYKMEQGRPTTPSLTQYIVPTSKDIPDENICCFIENHPGEDCPFGGMGLGEHTMFTAGPTLSNAIYDAVGVSMTKLPITPEKILKALNKI